MEGGSGGCEACIGNVDNGQKQGRQAGKIFDQIDPSL